eukprot:158382-Pyramimonas_sp.AAC.1
MKQLGFIKYHLNRLLGISLEDIRILRDELVVQVLGKMVAKITSGEVDYAGRGQEVKVPVAQSMREWDANGPQKN